MKMLALHNFCGRVGSNVEFPQIDCVLDYAPGASMRQEVYRVAYDEASAELSEILGRFEQLRLRKDRVEKVVEALKPLVMAAQAETAAMAERVSAPAERQPVAVETQAARVPAEPVQSSAPSTIPYPVHQPTGDPFGRREPVSAGSAAKDVSEYSRLFNTGVSRGN